MTIFERIKELANKQKISLQKVAEDLGLSTNYIYNLRYSKTPNADKLALIADYFGVSVDYLLGRAKDPKETFSEKLVQLRVSKNLTRNQIAKELGLPISSIAEFESGRHFPKMPIIQAMAKYFNVSIEYLLGYDYDSHHYYISEEKMLSDKKFVNFVKFLKSNLIILSDEEIENFYSMLITADLNSGTKKELFNKIIKTDFFEAADFLEKNGYSIFFDKTDNKD